MSGRRIAARLWDQWFRARCADERARELAVRDALVLVIIYNRSARNWCWTYWTEYEREVSAGELKRAGIEL